MQPGIARHDVFLSYSRPDRKTAVRIAEGLKSHGLSVWWDRELLPGDEFTDRIAALLDSSASVAVLWSAHSIVSRFVRNESELGAQKGKLVPARIEDVEIPLHVRNIHTVDLIGWKGDADDPAFLQFVQGVRSRIDGEPARAIVPPAAARPRRGLRRRWPWFAAAALLILATWVVRDRGLLAPDVRDDGSLPDLAQTPLTGDGITHGCRISPDGRHLLLARDESGQYSLSLKDISSGAERVLVPRDDHGIRTAVFAPGGDYVFFTMAGPTYSVNHLAEYDLYRLNLMDGEPQRILERIIGRRIACAPAGDRLAFMRTVGDSVLVMTARTNGTDERRIGGQPGSTSLRGCLAYSADGLLAFATERDTLDGKSWIVAHKADGTGAYRLPGGGWRYILDLHTAADGSGLLVVGQPDVVGVERQADLWFLPTDAPAPRRLTRDLRDYIEVSSDRSGSRIAAAYYNAKRTLRVLAIARPDAYRDIATDIVKNGRVVWTKAGRLLATQRFGNRVGMVLMNADGTGSRQIPVDVEYVADFDLSADGRVLAFTSWLGTDFSTWLANADGTAPTRLADSEGIEQFPVFSPDGRWLVFGRKAAAGQPYRLMRYDMRARTSALLAETPGIWPAVSPDGRRIAAYFTDPQTGKYRLGLIPSAGGEPQFPDIDGSFNLLCWNPQGGGLTCYRSEGGIPNIWDVPLDGKAPRRLTDFPPGHLNMPDLSWNAAGDSLAVVLEVPAFDAVLLEVPGGGQGDRR